MLHFRMMILFFLLLPLNFVLAEEEEVQENDFFSTEDVFSHYSDERNKYLKILREEIEPLLPPADQKQLIKNVLTLGSFHTSWSERAQNFLIANAPLAELYLYRHLLQKNDRLKSKILETLLAFPSYRYPKAAMAWVEYLGTSREEKIKTLRLLKKIAFQDTDLMIEVFRMLVSPWGEDLAFADRLVFCADFCSVLSRTDDGFKKIFSRWLERVDTFWDHVIAEEVKTCLFPKNL